MSHTHFYTMQFILSGGWPVFLYALFVRIPAHILSDIMILTFMHRYP